MDVNIEYFFNNEQPFFMIDVNILSLQHWLVSIITLHIMKHHFLNEQTEYQEQ